MIMCCSSLQPVILDPSGTGIYAKMMMARKGIGAKDR